ncbi:MAG: efflux RND transporter periplasmic adaptor subunit [Bacteriovoracaceae bacterium]|nr:efflux RND transporter periplasmic adaptor subunit [Bacteriovoracaceae bacterium]
MKTGHKEEFKRKVHLKDIQVSSWQKTFTKLLLVSFVFLIITLTITPWQQSSTGTGRITAIDPNDRVQYINAPVSGRINKWFVKDGGHVDAENPIVEIVDNDPNFVERLKIERDSAIQKFEVSKLASETAEMNYRRQQDLFKQGLSSRVTYEKAKITYKKLLSEEASAAGSLAKAEVKFSRQQSQLVSAQRSGTILSTLNGGGSVFVNEGDALAVFIPENLKPAAEIFVDGNDLPLVRPGRHVRLQFEGWPAIQFSGWPSVAVGTFGGIVHSVDPSVNKKGKFRVLIVPEENVDWPDTLFLRQGTRVVAWILLDTVKLGYELWRIFNGFPPTTPETNNPLEPQKKGKSKKKAKD